MKKAVKISLISVGSLLLLLIVVVGVALWLIFTPSKLTSIVNRVSDKVITCESHFESVDLTLWRTFPNVGLKVNNMVIVNPMQGAPSDTLAKVAHVVVGMDLKAFLKNDSIIVKQLVIDNPTANVYINAEGVTNYDIFNSSDEESTSESSEMALAFDINEVAVNHLNVDFINEQDSMHVGVRDLNIDIDGEGDSDLLEARLKLKVKDLLFDLKGDQFVTFDTPHENKYLLQSNLDAQVSLNQMGLTIHKGTLKLDNYEVDLNGDVSLATEDRDMSMDVAFKTNKWNIPQLLTLLPETYTSWQEGMEFDADVMLSGTVKGVMNDSIMPQVTADLSLSDGSFAYKEVIPYRLTHVNGKLTAWLDLSEKGISNLKLHELSARTGKNRLSLNGKVDDLLGEMNTDANLLATLRLVDLAPMLPKDMPLDIKGNADLKLHAVTDLAQIQSMDLAHMKVNGSMKLKGLDVVYDSITLNSKQMEVALAIPAKRHTKEFKELLSADIVAGDFLANVPQSQIVAEMSTVNVSLGVSDFMDEKQPLKVAADFDMRQLKAQMDTLSANITDPKGSFEMIPTGNKNGEVRYKINYQNRNMLAQMGDSLHLNVAGLSIKGGATYDSTRSNVLKQWSPNFDVQVMRGVVEVAQLPYTVQMPDFKFNYQPEKCQLSDANIVFGNSDFYLSGEIEGLEDWISHEGMLTGDLNFTSNYTNVDDLMDVFSGLGSNQDTLQKQREEDHVPQEANPFIVPKDVNITLHTNIRESMAFGNELQELAGNVIINDGVAILDQVGFVCKAARMQLTGMYKSPRPNHLFVGLDFHLLDIQIHELVDMIPYVDTIVPMLSAFDGNADFHLAAETYLFANYQPKTSTIRGAAGLTGKDLVVLDNETFDKIASLLMFKKKTQNKIDSLDVEMTVFRKEVDIYPFLLSMDTYQLCVAGRHTLDNAYNYHLEILHSPIPGRLAVDVKGVLPKLGFSLGSVQYAELYKPKKQGAVENQTLALKQLIRQSLESNVRESTRSRTRSQE